MNSTAVGGANTKIKVKTAAAQTSVGSLRTKADVFIYGLALSKSDNSLSSRYSNQGFNWGSADNPWLFRAGTEKVKQFKNIEKDIFLSLSNKSFVCKVVPTLPSII